MARHYKVGPRRCVCGYVAPRPKSLSGHVGGSNSKAVGAANGRWNNGRIVTSGGYVAVRVDHGHPHAWGPEGSAHKYAYEHVVVAVGYLGRPLDDEEIVHHKNGDRQDNRWSNLEVQTRSDHAKHHAAERGRDDLGRFPPAESPEDLRVREFPAVLP